MGADGLHILSIHVKNSRVKKTKLESNWKQMHQSGLKSGIVEGPGLKNGGVVGFKNSTDAGE